MASSSAAPATIAKNLHQIEFFSTQHHLQLPFGRMNESEQWVVRSPYVEISGTSASSISRRSRINFSTRSTRFSFVFSTLCIQSANQPAADLIGDSPSTPLKQLCVPSLRYNHAADNSIDYFSSYFMPWRERTSSKMSSRTTCDSSTLATCIKINTTSVTAICVINSSKWRQLDYIFPDATSDKNYSLSTMSLIMQLTTYFLNSYLSCQQN